MNIDGENLIGVYHAAPYIVSYYSAKLGYVNSYPSLGKSVAVVGGGLTAIDSCLVAFEQKVSNINLVYRRTRKEAPAGEKEIESLEKRGINVLELKVPTKIVGRDDNVIAIVTSDIRLGPLDRSGRPKPEIIHGSEKELPVDSVIVSVGGSAMSPFEKGAHNIALADDGRIIVDKKKKTTRCGVFAAGDVETGPSLIGPALKSGIDAATSIKEYIIKKRLN